MFLFRQKLIIAFDDKWYWICILFQVLQMTSLLKELQEDKEMEEEVQNVQEQFWRLLREGNSKHLLKWVPNPVERYLLNFDFSWNLTILEF